MGSRMTPISTPFRVPNGCHEMVIQMCILTPHIHPQYGQGMTLHIRGCGDGMQRPHHLYAMVHGHTRGMALRKGTTRKMVFTIPVDALTKKGQEWGPIWTPDTCTQHPNIGVNRSHSPSWTIGVQNGPSQVLRELLRVAMRTSTIARNRATGTLRGSIP